MGAPVGEGVAEIHIARPLMATLAIPRPTLQRRTPTYRNFEIVRIIGRQGMLLCQLRNRQHRRALRFGGSIHHNRQARNHP